MLTALERGGAGDWGRILNALDDDPAGKLREELAEALDRSDQDLQILALFRDALARPR